MRGDEARFVGDGPGVPALGEDRVGDDAADRSAPHAHAFNLPSTSSFEVADDAHSMVGFDEIFGA